MALDLSDLWKPWNGLEPEQIELFKRIVEATLTVGRENRQPFMYLRTMGGNLVKGNDFSSEVIDGDIETLTERGLLRVQKHSSSGFAFLVPPDGFAAYKKLRGAATSQFENVQDSVTGFLDSEAFRSRHSGAFAKWDEAAKLLWSSESERELSTIGHKCRESIQIFLTECLEARGISAEQADPQRTVDRLRELIANREAELGERRTDFFKALVAYWGTTSDLAQRQEHSAQREVESLNWEDGRLVVFQTAVLMYEVDRAI